MNVNKYWFTIIFHFDAIKNFIVLALTNREKFFTLKNNNIYNLIVIDTKLLLTIKIKIDREIWLLSIVTQEHYEKIIFDIILIVTSSIVLEMP